MPKHIISNARKLRSKQTDAEKHLWQHIRNKQLGYKFRRQHPIAPYVVDFYCDELRLVIELDGGQHAENVEYDEERTAHFKRSKIDVVRFWNNDVLENIEGVIDSLTPALSQRERELQAVRELSQGKVIAYPTEAVFGLGCDPDDEQAVHRILQIKNRSIEKGVIVIAGELAQLSHWIDADRLATAFPHVLDSWPGPNTWVLPCKPSTPKWLTGQFDTLAVRVSAHPTVQALCRAYGKGLVSTSANPSGLEPARSLAEVQAYFPELCVVDGEVDLNASPSVIRRADTQAIIRT